MPSEFFLTSFLCRGSSLQAMLKLWYLLSNVILFAAIYKHLEDSIYNFGGRTLIHDDIMEDQETNKEKARFDVFKA